MPESLLRGRRILIAEDAYFLADELDTTLKQAGAEMLGPIAAVQDGLRVLAANAVLDAASLDVNLGGESVYPLADALIARAVPFMFTTGYDQRVIPRSYAWKSPSSPRRCSWSSRNSSNLESVFLWFRCLLVQAS